MTIVKDPLLGAMRLLLIIFIGMTGLMAAGLALSAPLTVVFKDRILAALAMDGAADAAAIYPVLPLLLLLLAGLVASGVYFLILLMRIVASVGEGDPFAPINAERLSRMGWTLFAAQFAAIPIGVGVVYVAKLVEDSDHMMVRAGHDFGFSGGGILLTLVLFILARVFRQGALMREELEGTV